MKDRPFTPLPPTCDRVALRGCSSGPRSACWGTTRTIGLRGRAVSYGMPGVDLDGNDVLAVHDAARRAIERARQGMGPTLLECKTFRMTGHSAHDDANYVPKEIFEEWENRDPIRRYRRVLLEEEILRAEEIEDMQQQVVAEVDKAVEWAEKCLYPDPEECLKGVYFDGS